MAEAKLTRRILLLALVARILVFGAASQGVFPVGEGRTQSNLAENLLSGNGFMLSGSMLHPEREAEANPMFQKTFEFFRRVDGYYGGLRPDTPTMFLVPGYAVFMAFIYAVFGSGNFLAVRGIQLFLGLFTVLIGFRIARRFLSGKFLAFVGIFMALDPFELYYEAVPATQALFSLIFLISLLLSLKLLEESHSPRSMVLIAAATGFAWACSFYVRPVSLPLMIWMILLLPFADKIRQIFSMRRKRKNSLRRTEVFSMKGFSYSLVVLAVFMLLMLPWGLRNRAICGTFRIMPTQGGVNLWEYNGRIFTDHFVNEVKGAKLLYGGIRREYLNNLNSPELAEFPEFREESEWERDRILFERNTTFMLRNPVLTLRLISMRFIEFFKPFPLNSFSVLYTLAGLLSFFWILFFLWGGAVRCCFSKGAGGFYIATGVAGYALMHLLTASGTPHRVAIDYPMSILAVVGVQYSLERYQSWRAARNA